MPAPPLPPWVLRGPVCRNIDQSSLQTTSTASWCTARLTASGNDTYQLQVSSEDNPTLSNRQAIITVKAVEVQAVVTFTVNQQPGKPYVSFKDGGGDVTIDAQAKSWERILDSNIDFDKLTAASSEKWCTAKLESSGNGITLKLEAEENETIEERKATVTVKASTGSVNTSFVVTQQSAIPAISFVDGGEDQTITPDGKSWAWDVSSNIAFSEMEALSDAEWCTVELSQTTYPKKISLLVKVAKNESINERKAAVTVKSTRYDIVLSFNITQQAAAPTISFGSAQGTDQSIAAPAKDFAWTMKSNIPYSELTVTSSEAWCQVKLDNSSGSQNMKSFPLTTTISENMSDKQRQTIVTINSKKYNVSKSFMITQAAATFTVSQTTLGFERDGGNRTLTITSNASWLAECSADWVKLEQKDGYLTIRVSTACIDRTATITFRDKTSTTITVNQTKYKVGDTYSNGNLTGTVAYIGDNRRFIFQNTGGVDYWSSKSVTTGAKSSTNGLENTEKMRNCDTFIDAVWWIDKLNTGGVTGWYMPSIGELMDMKDFLTESTWSCTELSAVGAK